MIPQKKIVLISPFFKSPTPGGGVTLSREICEEWLCRGSEVYVFGIDYGSSSFKGLDGHKKLFFKGLIKYNDARYAHKMDFHLREATQRLLSSIKPDEIHIHNFHGMLGSVWAAVDSELRTVYTSLDFGLACQSFYLFNSRNEICEGPEPEKCFKCISEESQTNLKYLSTHLFGIGSAILNKNLSSLRKHFLFFNLRSRNYIKKVPENLKHMLPLFDRFDDVIAPSPPMATFISKYRTKKRVHNLGYPVSKDRIFSGVESQTPDQTLKLLFLGNSAKVKGWSFFLSVLESLPDGLNLEIIDGGGIIPLEKTNNSIRRYLKKSSSIASASISKAIKDCDATIVPSLWYENTPLVTIESLANQRPVIAANQPGISNVIQDEKNGFLLPPGDIKVWVDSLVKWAQNPKIVRELRDQCTYTFNVVEYMDALERLIL